MAAHSLLNMSYANVSLMIGGFGSLQGLHPLRVCLHMAQDGLLVSVNARPAMFSKEFIFLLICLSACGYSAPTPTAASA